jgi:hypothetical protein
MINYSGLIPGCTTINDRNKKLLNAWMNFIKIYFDEYENAFMVRPEDVGIVVDRARQFYLKQRRVYSILLKRITWKRQFKFCSLTNHHSY